MNNPCNAPWLWTCVDFDLNSTYSSVGKPWHVLRLSFQVNIWKELMCEQKIIWKAKLQWCLHSYSICTINAWQELQVSPTSQSLSGLQKITYWLYASNSYQFLKHLTSKSSWLLMGHMVQKARCEWSCCELEVQLQVNFERQMCSA